MKRDYMIIEDEFFAFERLRGMISEVRPAWSLTCHAESVDESVAYLSAHKPDLVFMDIELADQNCFEIFSRIDVPVPVIFITAYNEYAIRAFKVNSIDYLLKPLERGELVAAIEKFDLRMAPALPDYGALQELIQGSSAKERIVVSRGDSFICVETADVAFFFSEDKYTSLCTFAGQTYIIDDSLNRLETGLSRRQFFRASRSHIINIKAIREVRKHFNGRLKLILNVETPSGGEVLISAARRDEFLLWLGGEAKK